MKLPLWASAMALAVIAAPCLAQTLIVPRVNAPNGATVLTTPTVLVGANGVEKGTNSNPLPTTLGPLSAATSTPLIGSFTITSVTPTSGAATFASGTATIGPFTPVLGRDIVLTLQGAGPFSCQLLNSRDGGITKYPLTIFDTAIGGPYTSPVNSAITSESVAGTTEWLTCNGNGFYRVEQ